MVDLQEVPVKGILFIKFFKQNYRYISKSIYAPLHLFGALMRHETGQNLLLKSDAISCLLNDLFIFLNNFHLDTMDNLCCLKAKAALFALAQIIGNITDSSFFYFLIFFSKNR